MNSYFVVFETTSDCDNDCIYCYNIWKKKNFPGNRSINEDKKRLLENVIEKIKPAGICFTGGEPLLCPELPEFIELCRPKVKFLSLATNGKNLGEDFFSRISPKKLDLLDISLPTLRDDKYAEICKSEGSEKVKSAFILAKKNGFRVNLSVTAMKINMDEIEDILRFAFAFSLDSATINFFAPSGRGEFFREELSLSLQDKISIMKKADEFSEKTGLPVIFGIPFERCRADISSLKNIKMSTCLCGVVKFAVDFEGSIRPCEMSGLVLGNILSDDLESILDREALKKFRSENYLSECPSCVSYNYCMGSCRFSG
ncbi:radical SAM protein [candidate division WOR-3 bacterium]|nr:radical SAM protein [candidate division WOR-3 bacterium]